MSKRQPSGFLGHLPPRYNFSHTHTYTGQGDLLNPLPVPLNTTFTQLGTMCKWRTRLSTKCFIKVNVCLISCLVDGGAIVHGWKKGFYWNLCRSKHPAMTVAANNKFIAAGKSWFFVAAQTLHSLLRKPQFSSQTSHSTTAIATFRSPFSSAYTCHNSITRMKYNGLMKQI